MTQELVVTLRDLHPAQAQIVVEAKRFNVLQCGRRFGKTVLGADIAVEAMIAGKPVGWFAPTYKILDDGMRDVLRSVKDLLVSSDRQQRRYEIVTGGSIEFWSTDTPDPGRSRHYGIVVIDEASMIRDLESVWTEAVRPTLTDLKGDAWFLGTPKGRNYFHQLYVNGQTGEPGWASWRFTTVDNPHMDAAEIESARRDMPDLAFRQEYLGEAIEDAGNPFGTAAIAACFGDMSTAPVTSWGVDLAKSVDWTVLVGLDAQGRLAGFHRWQGDFRQTEDDVRRIVGTTRALVDSTGLGDPVLEHLQRGRANFEGFKFTAPSKQQLMEGLAAAIHQRAVRFPEVIPGHAQVLRHELEAFQYVYTASGVRYSAPEGMHDDTVCALALAVRLHTLPRATRGTSFVTL